MNEILKNKNYIHLKLIFENNTLNLPFVRSGLHYKDFKFIYPQKSIKKEKSNGR